jgi:hypothetical protein
MKAGFDGENPYPQRGQFRWKVNLYLGFKMLLGGKTKTCNANKEKTTPNKWRTVLEKSTTKICFAA